MLTRRHLLTLGAAGLLAPRRLGALSPTSERKFLFVFCLGGWDPTYVFAPLFDRAYVDTESDATTAEEGGVRFVDSEKRPSVRKFFEQYASQVAILNGFEVQSITHERCQRQLFTGSGRSDTNDWGAILAHHSQNRLLMPYLVTSGPSFSTSLTSEIVRLGPTGQVPDLLGGEAVTEGSTLPVSLPSAEGQALVDAWLSERIQEWGAVARRGGEQRFAEDYARALSQAVDLADQRDVLELTPSLDGGDLSSWPTWSTALDVLERGLSRAALVEHRGVWSATWDTHSDISRQSDHFEELFRYLNLMMQSIATRTSQSGKPLADELTVVVCSEMGRGPLLNSWNGKDHFTFTSAMLLGSGVAGGQVVGDFDDYSVGEPIDLASGELSESGTALAARHLGATLLALGDVDPAEALDDTEPITALMS